jgi:hypothetical protein
MPDLVYETEDAIPEDLKGTQKPIDGKFVVSVVPKVKLDEFRDNNIKLVKERDDLVKYKTDTSAVLGTDDLGKFSSELNELRSTNQKVKDGKLVEEKGLERAISERTAEMKTSFEGQLKDAGIKLATAETEKENFSNKFKRLLISQQVIDAIMDPKSGIRPDAKTMVVKEAFEVFRVKDDESIIPMKGDAVLYGLDGVSPMTPLEWLKKLAEQNPFILKESAGGGAAGGKTNINGIDVSKLTPAQKMTLAREGKLR